MRIRLLAVLVCAGTLCAPVVSAASNNKKGMSDDMRRAIAWERHKEAAAARQARIERRHPSVPPAANADRTMEEPQRQGRPVKDTGAPGTRRDKH